MPFRVITDGDDTLWLCSPHFVAAEWSCFDIMVKALPDGGLTFEAVVHHKRTIQRTWFKRYGFSLDWFPNAWVECYAQTAQRYGRQISTTVIEAIRAAANTVYDQEYPAYDGIAVTLEELLADGHDLHLLTLGDEAFQHKKVAGNGLDRFFNDHLGNIHVIQRSKGLKMKMLSQSAQRTVMVGDSEPSDIQPAVRIGIEAILVVSEDDWSRGHKPLPEHVHRVKSFTEVPALLRRLGKS